MGAPADRHIGGGYSLGFDNGFDEGFIAGERSSWDRAWAAMCALLPPEYVPRTPYPVPVSPGEHEAPAARASRGGTRRAGSTLSRGSVSAR